MSNEQTSYTRPGEIKMAAYRFDPRFFLVCDGRTLKKEDYKDLYDVIGTTYNRGTENSASFSIPDLRLNTIVGVGTSIGLGQVQGHETVELSLNQMPAHNHNVAIRTSDSSDSVTTNPRNAFLTNHAGVFSTSADTDTFLGGVTQESIGVSEAINIRSAYLEMNFLICYEFKL